MSAPKWYWNFDRLTKLRKILLSVSNPTSNPGIRLIPTPKALYDIVGPIYKRNVDSTATNSKVNRGLTILKDLGVLGPGRAGGKAKGQVRRLYPGVKLNAKIVEEYRVKQLK